MTFQIEALPAEPFTTMFSLSDQELKQRNARRMTVQAKPGSPCRVSLADAEIGEQVILLNYQHQEAETPFRASHAIFVREGAEQAHLRVNEVPEFLRSGKISDRAFDADHMMVDADVVSGEDLEQAIDTAFESAAVSCLHLHFAKPGCFAASVIRA